MRQGTRDKVQKSSPCISGPPALVPVYLFSRHGPQLPGSLTQAAQRTCRSVSAQGTLSLLSLARVLSAWAVLIMTSVHPPACDSCSLLASGHELPSTWPSLQYGRKRSPQARVGSALVMEARRPGSTQFHTPPTSSTWGR